ncbi:DUF2130 domain-containing protein [Candidatus Roizmanbacteria bacterium]|nr:DUF2130 domain-containing protein [Candidatus Roizmanbacteria bacterium]
MRKIKSYKGVRGADLLQIGKTRQGRSCGSIAWEFKRTKSWSTDWIVKLKEDQRAMKAELAVIVTQVLPFDMKRFGTKEGIWIGEYDCFLGLAYALRTHLLGLSAVRVSSVDKNEKMAVLYNYLSGVEFKQRIEAIVEAFTSLQLDIEKEKRFFATKWSKQEKNMRKVLDNTLGMHGDLESIIGKELGELPGLEALPDKV